jgi:uncharacterized membrane protein YccC
VLWRGLGDAVLQLDDAFKALMLAREGNQRSFASFLNNIIAVFSLLFLPFRTWILNLRDFRTTYSWPAVSAWPSDYTKAFVIKQYFLVCICLIVLLLVSPLQPIMGEPYGGWVVVSLLVVMQPSVEATAQRFVFRVVGSVVGCALGYAIMVHPTPAGSAAILSVFILVTTFVSAMFLETAARYAVFVFLIRLLALFASLILQH